jgi:hypothetical protein
VGPHRGPPKKKDSTLKSNHNMKLTFQLPKLPNGDIPEINIRVPKTYWMGKVQPGEYFLDTPYSYACSQMIPLPAVQRMMDNGELPHVVFREERYVLRLLPALRAVKPIDDSFEPAL